MKKTLLVLVMASVMLFALSGVAMAKVTNGYVPWDATPAALDGTQATPHIGYTVNTDKCAVCHSVHNAPVAGTQWSGTNPWSARTGEETQMLLRSSVANACVYCHIETAIGGVQLYNGDATKWTSPVAASFGENVAHNRGSANCVNCHAVHGAGTFKGLATAKILKAPVQATFQDEVFVLGANVNLDGGLYATRDAAVADTTGLGKDYQVTVFCTQCHQNFSRASETTLNTDGDYVYGDAAYVDGDPIANKQFKSHPMKSSENTTVGAGATFGGTTAWKNSNTCRSCHDAGFTDQAAGVTDSNFPHYTAGAYNFVKVAANAAVSAAASGNNHASDGMCLKCHVQDGTGVNGVGASF